MINKNNINGGRNGAAEPVITPELLESMRAGSQAAFEIIYLRYAIPVCGFLKTLLRSEELGEEMTQEVFVALWENREKIDPQNNISGYIYTIARNIAFKHFRRQRDLHGENLLTAEGGSDNITPHDELITKETELIIDVAIAAMPPQRREIFMLSRKKGMSNCEIAAKLQISKNTVENQITTALKYLRNVVSTFRIIIFV